MSNEATIMHVEKSLKEISKQLKDKDYSEHTEAQLKTLQRGYRSDLEDLLIEGELNTDGE